VLIQAWTGISQFVVEMHACLHGRHSGGPNWVGNLGRLGHLAWMGVVLQLFVQTYHRLLSGFWHFYSQCLFNSFRQVIWLECECKVSLTLRQPSQLERRLVCPWGIYSVTLPCLWTHSLRPGHLFFSSSQYSTAPLNLLLVMSNFLSQQNNRLFLFLSELMDLFVAGRDQSAADQPNYLAEGHPPL